MRAIAFTNQKGGVGKTTSTANLGACLALKGKRVLIIDIDPQANLSAHFGVDIHHDCKSSYDLISSNATAEDVVRPTEIEGLDIVPSDINLAGAEIELVGVVGRETILKEALAPLLPRYDYVLFDCPPSLGLLTLNALTTVQEVFIPVQTEFFALQGMSKLLETVDIVRKRINRSLRISGIIPSMFDARTNLAHEVLANIREYFGDMVFRTVVRKNVRLAESPSHGKAIVQYDMNATGARDYMALADEVIAQEGPDGIALPGAGRPIDAGTVAAAEEVIEHIEPAPVAAEPVRENKNDETATDAAPPCEPFAADEPDAAEPPEYAAREPDAARVPPSTGEAHEQA